jgi:hypothetical protein
VFQKIRKTLLVSSAFVGAISMALYTILENTYVNYPRAPDQLSGRVTVHEVKGITVYITPSQSETIHWIIWILVVSGALTLISLLVNLRWPIDSSAR